MMLLLSEAAKATSGQLLGEDVAFDAVTSDSRAIRAGDLFVALPGERFDGHDFVADCFKAGASAAMVAREVPGGGPQLLVEDTRAGLRALAGYWRRKFDLPVVAVTGSNGKTTVKEMLASILAAAAGSADAVLATRGNLNNDIGVPLTLLRMRADQRYAVVEMGMNHPGEIAVLTRIARPTVAIITNAQPAHLEGLGSVEEVANAKAEIFQGLAAYGTAVINADDVFAPMWLHAAAPRKVLTFGLNQSADVSAEYFQREDCILLRLQTPQGLAQIRLPVLGRHNVYNAMAAAAAALAMLVPLPQIIAGLESFSGVKGRQQRKAGKGGATIIDDTYNANPASVSAAINVLAAQRGKRILVLGDMGELGEQAERRHTDAGDNAMRAGIDRLMTLGELTARSAQAFGAGATHYASIEELVAALKPELGPDTTVLVKGSRFMRMERVVALLTEDQERSDEHAA